jgi:dynein heavy chain, axonemal
MKLEDLIILTSMGPPGGGRTFITNRVVRHFNLLGYTELSQDTIKTIFSILLNHFLKRHNDPVKNLLNATVDSVLSVYNTIKNDLLPTPSK